jgi:acetyl/propionyl-CoA carboxylase alpha subunit
MPSTGHLAAYHEPGGPGVRVDSGFVAGDTIPLYYDPLLAKLIVWGENRAQAIDRMKRALSEYAVQGVETTIPFGLLVMNNRNFIAGQVSTHFITEEFPDLTAHLDPMADDLEWAAMAAAIIEYQREKRLSQVPARSSRTISAWKKAGRAAGLKREGRP